MNDNERLCIECERLLRGRPDKKFCCDACRNTYNNRQNSDHVNIIRNINNLLRKNRRLLEEAMGGEKNNKYPRLRLIEAGFSFRYHTHQYTNKNGHTYNFCYDYGYLEIGTDLVLIVRDKEITPQ